MKRYNKIAPIYNGELFFRQKNNPKSIAKLISINHTHVKLLYIEYSNMKLVGKQYQYNLKTFYDCFQYINYEI